LKPSSAKAKGRILQQWIRDAILAAFPTLEPDDVRSTAMGQNGSDVQLSPAAQRKFPYAVECKNLAKCAAYSYYEQAITGSDKLEPLVVLKINRKKPLVLIDAERFMELVKNSGQSNRK
jgi:hypothetical protein